MQFASLSHPTDEVFTIQLYCMVRHNGAFTDIVAITSRTEMKAITGCSFTVRIRDSGGAIRADRMDAPDNITAMRKPLYPLSAGVSMLFDGCTVHLLFVRAVEYGYRKRKIIVLSGNTSASHFLSFDPASSAIKASTSCSMSQLRTLSMTFSSVWPPPITSSRSCTVVPLLWSVTRCCPQL